MKGASPFQSLKNIDSTVCGETFPGWEGGGGDIKELPNSILEPVSHKSICLCITGMGLERFCPGDILFQWTFSPTFLVDILSHFLPEDILFHFLPGDILPHFWMAPLCWAYILNISWAYLGHILGIFWAYLRHISGISRAYFGHFLGISWAYLGHILDISWARVLTLNSFADWMSEDVLSGMYVLSGWTFCQDGRFVRKRHFVRRTCCQDCIFKARPKHKHLIITHNRQ